MSGCEDVMYVFEREEPGASLNGYVDPGYGKDGEPRLTEI